MEDLVIYNSRSFCYILGCISGYLLRLDIEKRTVNAMNERNMSRFLDALYENNLEFSETSSIHGTVIHIHNEELFRYIESIEKEKFPPILKMYDIAHKWDFHDGLEDCYRYLTKYTTMRRNELLMEYPEMLDHVGR